MSDPRFKLYYWPISFRGCFVSYQFAYRDEPLALATTAELLDMKSKPAHRQEIPFVGPPVLLDRKHERYLSQMPAAVFYAADHLDLMPQSNWEQAQCIKVLMDCNDVLMEIVNYNGSKMWDRESWGAFRSERLPRWMQIFEESLNRGVIGRGHVTFADLGTFALFGNMTRYLAPLAEDLSRHAPGIQRLCKRFEGHPSLEKFREEEVARFGEVYCGGQIGASIDDMLGL